MTPQARQIIYEVAARHRVAPELIVGRCRAHRLMIARVEVARLLTFRGYSTTQIGAVLDRDHTTVVFYLGRGKRQPSRPRWRKPKIKTLWVVSRKRLVPYAGAERSE